MGLDTADVTRRVIQSGMNQQVSLPLPVILHIAPIAHNQASGLTMAVPSMVGALHRFGAPTGLLTTFAHGPYEKPQPYPVVYLRNLPLHAPVASLPKPLNEPDLVVFHSTYIPAHALLAYQAYRKAIPYVIAPHGGMTHGAQQIKRLKKMIGNALFFKRMVRRAGAIHCLTEREAIDVRAWGCPAFVVGNGVDLPPADHLAQPGRGGGLQFVFLGRLDLYHKGLDLLVNACSLVRDELRKARAQVHLYGPDVRGSKTIIERMITANGLQRLVQIHGPVYGAEKEKAFRSADIFLHTSRFEGHPIAVLEALSYGVPCLLTSGTNVSSEVALAGAGWKAGTSAETIAIAIGKILDGNRNLADMGTAARKLAKEKYSWDQVARQLLEHYLEIVKG